ncbi:hypothetical protein QFZ52_002470 [Arthrobacter woluwensis]|nr:hypothetical protein [Arthrobacter woluwensis]
MGTPAHCPAPGDVACWKTGAQADARADLEAPDPAQSAIL